MTVHWYAIHSKPMKEAFLAQQLSLHQVENYFPCLRIKPVNPRARKNRAYFPGYVFGRVDLEQTNLSILQWMPGSTGIICFDGMPSIVPDSLIGAIRQKVDEINASRGKFINGLRQGDVVMVHEGAFKGYEAIFDACLSGNDRVRVLLKLLSRQHIPLELPSGQIQRKT